MNVKVIYIQTQTHAYTGIIIHKDICIHIRTVIIVLITITLLVYHIIPYVAMRNTALCPFSSANLSAENSSKSAVLALKPTLYTYNVKYMITNFVKYYIRICVYLWLFLLLLIVERILPLYQFVIQNR